MIWKYNNWLGFKTSDPYGKYDDIPHATVEALRAIAEQLEKIHEDLYHISILGSSEREIGRDSLKIELDERGSK